MNNVVKAELWVVQSICDFEFACELRKEIEDFISDEERDRWSNPDKIEIYKKMCRDSLDCHYSVADKLLQNCTIELSESDRKRVINFIVELFQGVL